jgi:hypothetical protein
MAASRKLPFGSAGARPRAAWCATAGGACRDAVLFLFFEMDDRSLLPVLIFNGICPPHYS